MTVTAPSRPVDAVSPSRCQLSPTPSWWRASSREVDDAALPVLEQETLQAQKAQIDSVAGATVTSDGHLTSLLAGERAAARQADLAVAAVGAEHPVDVAQVGRRAAARPGRAGGVLARADHGPAWQVAVEDPRDRTRRLCVLPLQSAVATSGTAARGRHTTDLRTGRAADDQLRSATVVRPSLTWTDVLATAVYVEGPAALERVTELSGLEALLALPDGRLSGTPGVPALPGERHP